VRNEYRIMKAVRGHKNVVQLEAAFEDESDVHIVMEICSGGELFDRIVAKGHYSEKDAAEALRSMLHIIEHCKKHGVIHRDLKPENYLLTSAAEDAELKLTDFGLSKFLPLGRLASEVVGTPGYIAPEVLRRSYDYKADIWSAGCILYILLSGKLPFYGINEKEELRATLRGRFDIRKQPWPTVSAEAKEVVTLMLTMDRGARPGAEELLEHPWVRENGIASTKPLVDTVRKGLKEFLNMNRLKKRALQVIATNLSQDGLDAMRDTFEAIDADKNGTITIQELRDALARSGAKLPEAEIRDMLEAYDVDGDGTIDYSEFLTATTNLQKLTTVDNIRNCFRELDLDGDGSLTREEVSLALHDCNLEDEDLRKILSDADTNGDGRIDYFEFLEMMKARDTQMRDAASNIKYLHMSVSDRGSGTQEGIEPDH